jgi:hypothetical protein
MKTSKRHRFPAGKGQQVRSFQNICQITLHIIILCRTTPTDIYLTHLIHQKEQTTRTRQLINLGKRRRWVTGYCQQDDGRGPGYKLQTQDASACHCHLIHLKERWRYPAYHYREDRGSSGQNHKVCTFIYSTKKNCILKDRNKSHHFSMLICILLVLFRISQGTLFSPCEKM